MQITGELTAYFPMTPELEHWCIVSKMQEQLLELFCLDLLGLDEDTLIAQHEASGAFQLEHNGIPPGEYVVKGPDLSSACEWKTRVAMRAEDHFWRGTSMWSLDSLHVIAYKESKALGLRPDTQRMAYLHNHIPMELRETLSYDERKGLLVKLVNRLGKTVSSD